MIAGFFRSKLEVFDLAGTRSVFLKNLQGRSSNMPTAKEFSIRLEDRPGTLGKVCQALAGRGVNILAFQSSPGEGKSQVRIVVDNPTTARTVLDSERQTYTEAEVAQVKLANRSGELARVASKLGESNININHAYCGVEPGTNAPLLIIGVSNASKAASILDESASAASGR
jgi:hypothetical protein